MCNNHSCFTSIKDLSSDRSVTVANGFQIPVSKIGEVVIIIKSHKHLFKLKLSNVLYVPQLSINLISVRALTSNGSKVVFENNSCQFITNNHEVRIAQLENNQYFINQHKIHTTMLCIHDWHRVLAHRNLKDIKNLENIKIKSCKCSDDCIGCFKGKLTQKPFPKISNKPLNRLDVIVSDLGGQLVKSLGGSVYYQTITDVFSDYTEVHFLKNKDDSNQVIMNFVAKTMNCLGDKPKIFRTDRGGEFVNQELQSFLNRHGIVIQKTVHDSPQQNGIAERKNRTLMDAVRSMLQHKNLPNYLWAEAMNHACYTFNHMPKTSGDCSPIEKFLEKSTTPQFKEFGSKIFFATNPNGRRKLDPRGQEGIFVGFDNESKGYRIFAYNNIV